MRRTLSLARDVLAELTTGELSAVAGGRAEALPPTFDECPLTGPYPTLPINDCLTNTIVTSEAAR